MKFDELLNAPTNMAICRAKTIPEGQNDTSEWVEGYYLLLNGRRHFVCNGYAEFDCGEFHPVLYPVEEDTIGFYTGVNDTKRTAEYPEGQKIFVGDIINGLHRFGMLFKSVADFQDGSYGLSWEYNGIKHFSAFTSICNVEMEVVGNIFDNPEMIEEVA